MAGAVRESELGVFQRLWAYQRERFPLAAHGTLVAVIAASGIGFSLAARSAVRMPVFDSWLVAFVVAFGFFLQLRVADEYKDLADDTRYRPYRPVPRGLVTLRELSILALALAILQIVLSFWLSPIMLAPLLVVWLYMMLMRYEFFAPEWLKTHAVLYMLSHMVILPLIFVYITGCDWLAAGLAQPQGLGWFLATGYVNGLLYEIGRKMRSPQDEEIGVETYSKLWGPRRAAAVWTAALAVAGLCAVFAASAFGWTVPIALLVTAGAIGAVLVALRYARLHTTKSARLVEAYSALWMLVLYAGVGIVPGLLRVWLG